jgi:glycosyltransferase involved in cell wall biosynthesis
MVSVVVCTHNPRKEYLERCIQAIEPQVRGRMDREFLIIDNDSDPPVATLDCVRSRQIKTVREERLGLTAARECAARVASHEVIVFADDDNVLSATFLDTATDMLSDSRIGVLGAQVEPEYETPPARWALRFQTSLGLRWFPSDLVYLTSIPEYTEYFPIGAGCCIRTGILREYFNSLGAAERIEGRRGSQLSSGEDVDIDLFAISRGYQLAVSRRLRVTHLIPGSRLTYAYFHRLLLGALDSSFLINQKWRARFGRDVFAYLSGDQKATLLKALLYTGLSFRTEYRLLAQIHRRLLSLSRVTGPRA